MCTFFSKIKVLVSAKKVSSQTDTYEELDSNADSGVIFLPISKAVCTKIFKKIAYLSIF